jgi:hypothetical protein
MKDAKWAGDAGTDQWNICVSHSTGFVNPGADQLQVVAWTRPSAPLQALS